MAGVSRFDRFFNAIPVGAAPYTADQLSDQLNSNLGMGGALLLLDCTYASAGVDEVQTVTINGAPTGGDFKLTFGDAQTGNIAYNAAASAVQTALRALTPTGYDPSAVTVAGSAGGPYTVTFAGGTVTKEDVPLMTADATGLTGGTSPSVTVVETTKGETAAATLALTVQVYSSLTDSWLDYATSGNMLTTSAGKKAFVVHGAAVTADMGSDVFAVKRMPMPSSFRVKASVSGTYTFGVDCYLLP